ncbi:hypothetical protein [Pseudanabaena sp. PCC 6802]|uniref:hypothetical protein n=1 Tax=Pseudanabaena sp. PCC 6802 TaxID=118173 RepID=UPI000347D0E8|nr:hypothetical protein [Pseudanabaena sp. PCC 6802]
MDELKPILQELFVQPVAFMGGLVSGFLRLDLKEDPLKTWLEKQGASPASNATNSNGQNKNSGPQTISID